MQKNAVGAGNLTLQGVQDGIKHVMAPRAPTPAINLKNPMGTNGFQGLGKNVSDMVSGAKQTVQKQLSQVPDMFNGSGSFGGGGFDPRMFEELYRQHQQRGTGAQAAEIGGATGFGLGAGALLGGAAGSLVGYGRGNTPEGLGRGVVRGGATGAGLLGGAALGQAIGNHINPQYGGLGAALGGAAGGLLGYGGSGLLLGEPEAERRKKQQLEMPKTAADPESLVPPNPFKGYLTDEKYHEIRTDPRVREAQLNAARYGYQDMIDTRKREALERFYRWQEQNRLTEYGLGGVAANTGAGLGAGALVGGAAGAALGGGRGAIQGGATGAGALGGGVVGHAIGSSINPQYGGIGAVLGGAAGGLLGYGGSGMLLGEPEGERSKKQEAAKVAAALVAPTSTGAVTGGAAPSAPKPAAPTLSAPTAGPINMQGSRRRTMGRAAGAV